MYDNVGVNNSKVFPKIVQKKVQMTKAEEEEKMSVKEELEHLSKPVRQLMNE